MHLCVAIGMTDIFAIMAGPARNDQVSPEQTKNSVEYFVLNIVVKISIKLVNKLDQTISNFKNIHIT